jgi:nucleoside 2-deoxyribosyltransferase
VDKTVYLAGPITGQSYKGCTDWREAAIRELAEEGIIGVSPMRGKYYLENEGVIGDAYPDKPMSSEKGITTRDRFDATGCSVLLANFSDADRVSVGTCIELGWADANRRPIIVVMEEGNPHWHSMVRAVSGFIVPDLDEAIKIAKAIFRGYVLKVPVPA